MSISKIIILKSAPRICFEFHSLLDLFIRRAMLKLWALQRPSTLCQLRQIHTTVINNATPVAKAAVAEPEVAKKWTPNSIRTGLIARKRGMT